MARNFIPRFIAAYDQTPDLSQAIQVFHFLSYPWMQDEAPSCRSQLAGDFFGCSCSLRQEKRA